MKSPFHANYEDQADSGLIDKAVAGDKKALEALLLRHQPFIYNVVLKMFLDPDDARDITQEILIKVITSLVKFEGRSSFRTWLYRIAVNHVLTVKKSKTEEMFKSFAGFEGFLDSMPDTALSPTETTDLRDAIEEVRLSCMGGMLLCLSREQRIVFVLGEVFHIDHNIASEILDISPDNFRQKLSRARGDLYSFMNGKCGLVNSNNPCRCPKKTKALIASGIVDPTFLKFNTGYVNKIRDVLPAKAEKMVDTFEEQYQLLYQDHPFQVNMTENVVREILKNKNIRDILNLD